MSENNKDDFKAEELAEVLYKKLGQDKKDQAYASTKKVLSLLGLGATIAAAIIAPNAATFWGKKLLNDDEDWNKWKQFDQAYLKQTLRRLEKQKLVEIKHINGKERIIITSAGRTKILEYAIDELAITKSKKWDRKWRIVIYDIPNDKKRYQTIIRKTLKELGFLPIQESVYLTPYRCYKEIEFLREYYYLGEHLKYLLVEQLEDDSVYKTYFGLT